MDDKAKKRTIGFIPMPHASDKDRPFNGIKVRCPNADCEAGGVHEISVADLPREHLPQIEAAFNALSDRLRELRKTDPQAIELIEPMQKAGFNGADPLVEAIGMSPLIKLVKETAPYDPDAVRMVRYPLIGQNSGQPEVMDPPMPPENYKLACAEHFKRLPPLVQFTVLERLIARGFAPEDFGLHQAVPVA